MRGASRGVLEVEQPDRAGAENSPAFVWAGFGTFARPKPGVRRPRLRLASEVPGGHGTPAVGHYDPSARSSLDWDWMTRGPHPWALVPGSPARGQKSPQRCAERRRGSRRTAAAERRRPSRPHGGNTWRFSAPRSPRLSQDRAEWPSTNTRTPARRGKENPCLELNDALAEAGKNHRHRPSLSHCASGISWPTS
jgi:hypothetical protein